jgi:hypothetical protein
MPIKIRSFEKLKMAGETSIVLVSTIAKGVNDAQVGDIVRFASRNIDLVKGVDFQPISSNSRWQVDPHLLINCLSISIAKPDSREFNHISNELNDMAESYDIESHISISNKYFYINYHLRIFSKRNHASSPAISGDTI